MSRLTDKGMLVFPLNQPKTARFEDGDCSTQVATNQGQPTSLQEGMSHYIVVHEGDFLIHQGMNQYRLGTACFGSVSGAASISGRGLALIVSNSAFNCPVLFGGPVEQIGRLRYVDGCTTSLLLAPPVRGEPCLNFMHLPGDVCQTMHTHPSIRVGVILSGTGKCAISDGHLDFTPGTVFVIPPGVPHSFQSECEPLRIVIYHPDSDSGPTHTDHTMLNRTFVRGRSARDLVEIHTEGSR